VAAKKTISTESVGKSLQQIQQRADVEVSQPTVAAGPEATHKWIVEVEPPTTHDKLIHGAQNSPAPLSSRVPTSEKYPRVALVTVSIFRDSPLPEANVFDALREALLQRGLDVNVELQNPEFLASKLRCILSREGKCLRRIEAKHGRQWDYVVVFKVQGKQVENEKSAAAFDLTADSLVYNRQGDLVWMKSFFERVSKSSLSQARDAAISELSRVASERVQLEIIKVRNLAGTL
jgi:hypothetical protein